MSVDVPTMTHMPPKESNVLVESVEPVYSFAGISVDKVPLYKLDLSRFDSSSDHIELQDLNKLIGSILEDIQTEVGELPVIHIACTIGQSRSPALAKALNSTEGRTYHILSSKGGSAVRVQEVLVDHAKDTSDMPYGLEFYDPINGLDGTVNLLVVVADEFDANYEGGTWEVTAMALQQLGDNLDNFKVLVIVSDEVNQQAEKLFKL